MKDEWEKVSKGLECCLSAKHPIPCHKCDYYNNTDYNDVWSCRLSLMRDARELLKAQEPMKPKVKHFEFHYASYDEYENRAYCPKCGIQLIQQVNYCPNCGRAVKWND